MWCNLVGPLINGIRTKLSLTTSIDGYSRPSKLLETHRTGLSNTIKLIGKTGPLPYKYVDICRKKCCGL